MLFFYFCTTLESRVLLFFCFCRKQSDYVYPPTTTMESRVLFFCFSITLESRVLFFCFCRKQPTIVYPVLGTNIAYLMQCDYDSHNKTRAHVEHVSYCYLMSADDPNSQNLPQEGRFGRSPRKVKTVLHDEFDKKRTITFNLNVIMAY